MPKKIIISILVLSFLFGAVKSVADILNKNTTELVQTKEDKQSDDFMNNGKSCNYSEELEDEKFAYNHSYNIAAPFIKNPGQYSYIHFVTKVFLTIPNPPPSFFS